MANTAVDNHAPPSEVDSFVKLATRYPAQAALLMFWMARHQNPEFTIELAPADLVAFRQCMEYLDVMPELRVFRPPGIAAVEGQPAHGNRRAVAARPARPGKNVVIIQMVDGEGNAIVPIENNEEDQKEGKRYAAVKRARDAAPSLANTMANHLASGTMSNATIEEAIASLRLLGHPG